MNTHKSRTNPGASKKRASLRGRPRHRLGQGQTAGRWRQVPKSRTVVSIHCSREASRALYPFRPYPQARLPAGLTRRVVARCSIPISGGRCICDRRQEARPDNLSTRRPPAWPPGLFSKSILTACASLARRDQTKIEVKVRGASASGDRRGRECRAASSSCPQPAARLHFCFVFLNPDGVVGALGLLCVVVFTREVPWHPLPTTLHPT